MSQYYHFSFIPSYNNPVYIVCVGQCSSPNQLNLDICTQKGIKCSSDIKKTILLPKTLEKATISISIPRSIDDSQVSLDGSNPIIFWVSVSKEIQKTDESSQHNLILSFKRESEYYLAIYSFLFNFQNPSSSTLIPKYIHSVQDLRRAYFDYYNYNNFFIQTATDFSYYQIKDQDGQNFKTLALQSFDASFQHNGRTITCSTQIFNEEDESPSYHFIAAFATFSPYPSTSIFLLTKEYQIYEIVNPHSGPISDLSSFPNHLISSGTDGYGRTWKLSLFSNDDSIKNARNNLSLYGQFSFIYNNIISDDSNDSNEFSKWSPIKTFGSKLSEIERHTILRTVANPFFGIYQKIFFVSFYSPLLYSKNNYRTWVFCKWHNKKRIKDEFLNIENPELRKVKWVDWSYDDPSTFVVLYDNGSIEATSLNISNSSVYTPRTAYTDN